MIGRRTLEAVKGDAWFARVLAMNTLVLAAVYAMRPMASYRALDLGAGPFELGLVAASFAALSLLVATPVGRSVDQIGERRLVLLGLLLLAGTSLATVWIDSIWGLALSQAIFGLGVILYLIAAQTLVANRSKRGERDHRFAQFTVFVSIGQLAGPLAAGIVAGLDANNGADARSLNLGPAFLFCAVAAGAAIAIAAGLPRSDRLPDHSQSGVTREGIVSASGRILRRPGMIRALVAGIAVVTSVDILAAYLPAYGEQNQLSVEFVGLLLSIRAGFSLLSRVLMNALIRALGRQRLLAGSMLLAGLGLAALPLTAHQGVLVLIMALLGIGLGVGQPLTLAWVADDSPEDTRGTALGLRMSGNRLGQLAIPALMGALGTMAGVSAIFVALAVLVCLAAGTVSGFTSPSARKDVDGVDV